MFREPKNSSFESSLWRESFETHVRSDFPMIFVTCAQTRTCEKLVKTYVFSLVFVGAVFFEKVSAVDSKSANKSLKSVAGGIKIHSKSSPDRRKSLFGALSERFCTKKASNTEPKTAKSGVEAAEEGPRVRQECELERF